MTNTFAALEAFGEYNPRRVLLPYGPGRQFATGGSGLLISGQGCITYASAYETTGSAAASLSIFDGWGTNGQQLIDYTLTEGESTSEILGLHWMQFTEGLYVDTLSGSVAGTLTAWTDHDCAAYNGALFHMSVWAKLELEARLAQMYP